jgi:DNA-binding NarL/FixJ family response regulator
MTRVIVVEDEPQFRQMLLSQLAADKSIQIVGQAQTGEMAVALAEETEPEVCLMDIELAGEMTGIEAGHAIKSARPSVGIVLLSNHRAKQFIVNMAGWSYLLKQNVRDLDSVVRAIKGAAWGLIVVDPMVTESLTPRTGSVLAQLEPDEVKMLELVAQGYNERGIADEMVTSVEDADARLDLIYAKLGILTLGESDPRVAATRLYLEQTRGW